MQNGVKSVASHSSTGLQLSFSYRWKVICLRYVAFKLQIFKKKLLLNVVKGQYKSHRLINPK